MQIRSYRLRFVTPAFLGNAEQIGQWRTPPIKALLRQFWRVAYAAEHNFKVDLAAMRREEGLLFGHAWLEDDKDSEGRHVAARKSAIRIRLSALAQQPAWAEGSQQGIQPLGDGLNTSYAWFGLIKRGRGLPDRRGIKADSTAGEATRQLDLAFPAGIQQSMDGVMNLVHAFGLLGSRSRGGWGALHVEGITPMSNTQIQRYVRPLDVCLQDDWPMSLAADQHGPCIWHSKATFKSWDAAMRFIATERRLVRTTLKGLNGKDLRPALGFASSGRMPSPLRWKVIPEGDALKVRTFAMPHRIPDDGGQRMHPADLQIAWRSVCTSLDTAAGFCPRTQ